MQNNVWQWTVFNIMTDTEVLKEIAEAKQNECFDAVTAMIRMRNEVRNDIY